MVEYHLGCSDIRMSKPKNTVVMPYRMTIGPAAIRIFSDSASSPLSSCLRDVPAK